MLECFCVAIENKILPDRRPLPVERAQTVACDEGTAFQVAMYSDTPVRDVTVEIVENGKRIADAVLRGIEYVPCTMPTLGEHDDYYISDRPFLCADILRPIDKTKPFLREKQWGGVWVNVPPRAAGQYTYTVRVIDAGGNELGVCATAAEVVDCQIGKPDFIFTNWFHYDGIAQYYRLPVFSDAYNRIVDRFIESAVAHGMNMLLIPLFTPPLDTRVGQERLTVQLVDVTVKKGKYAFGFDRLLAYMRRVQKLGIEYFEMSHLFTQWGAAAAPKVVADVDGEKKRIFGWDTPAVGGAYERFLSAFLPALRTALVEAGLYRACRFHVSDEPSDTGIEKYAAARALFKRHLPDAPLMDAVSHYAFYESGLVDVPIVATNAIQTFLDHNVEKLWAYSCCVQGSNYLSNRFIAMPGERTRVIGLQLFLNNCVGFLHWGYNFYNTQNSDEPIDPYAVNDACGAFPSGDSFIVYPGAEGPIDSVRHELTAAAWRDLALMQRLAEKVGRPTAEKLLTDNGFGKNFTEYPHDSTALRNIRDTALRMLAGRE